LSLTLRQQMPALASKHYFNYGGQGPLPTPSLEAMVASWQKLQQLGPFGRDVWPWLNQELGSLRRALGQLCGVSPRRLALTENVTSGCVLPLWGLPFEPGDRLLISDAEHPGVVAACRELARRQGLEIDYFPVQQVRTDAELLGSLGQGLQGRTRLVVLSHLLWNSGIPMPIAAVAQVLEGQRRRPWLLVDAAQSVGSIELGAAPAAADIFAFTGHKWCCGPEGLGAVVLSERLLAEASPTLIGWRSLSHEGEAGSGWHQDGRRFEVATSCVPLGAGLRQSLELLEGCGNAAKREAEICLRSAQLWGGLQAIPGVRTLVEAAPPPSGLVSFVVEGHQPEQLVNRLADQGFQLRSLGDPHCLRACTHLTTSAGEVEALLLCLEGLVHQG
jgi:L-cysteine/cystine lyase